MEDLTGLSFHHLTAVQPTDKRECGSVVWVWNCKCGNTTEARAAQVKNGHVKSCGCYRRVNGQVRKVCRHCGEISNRRGPSGNFVAVCSKCWHKQSGAAWRRTPTRIMLAAAKVRAKKAGVPFSLKLEDLVVPEFCPILGIKLEHGTVWERDSSPSLDRVRPELGYTPSNIAVISHYANRLKNNGTAEEHRKIADWMDSFAPPN